MLVAGGWILANPASYRGAEARSTARLITALADRGTALQTDSATVFVALATDHGVGLRIDQLCSSGPVAGVVLLLTSMLIAAAGVRIGRALLGAALLVGLVAWTNAVRLTLLAWTAANWGLDGWFEWLHLYGGAAATMLALIAGCALYLWMLRRPRVAAPAAG